MNDQWLKRWQEGQITFHEGKPNVLLEKHFHSLRLPLSKCLVPLCGKAVDMRWIYDHGHAVTGVEISEIAIRDFYVEQKILPQEPHLKLIQDDFLKFGEPSTYDWIYDRAALIALPVDTRSNYVQHQRYLLKKNGTIILISVNYDTNLMSGPPFALSSDEIQRLYSFAKNIDAVDEREIINEAPHLQTKIKSLQETLWRIQL